MCYRTVETAPRGGLSRGQASKISPRDVMLKARDHTVDFAHISASSEAPHNPASSSKMLMPPSSLSKHWYICESSVSYSNIYDESLRRLLQTVQLGRASMQEVPLNGAQPCPPAAQVLQTLRVVLDCSTETRSFEDEEILIRPPYRILCSSIQPLNIERTPPIQHYIYHPCCKATDLKYPP